MCALLLLFLLPITAGAADLCRDSAGRFTVCPEPPAPERKPLQIRAYAGGLTAIATDADAAVEPLASLQVLAPLTTSDKGPSLFVKADLTALPGETLSFDSVETFKAIELGVSVIQPLGGPLLFSLYAEGGFASRLAVESDPVDRLPGWASFGFLFSTSDGGHSLRVGMGPDERLSGEWSPCVHVSGQAKVGERAGVSMYLVGSLIRALDLTAYGYRTPARDSIRLGIAVGM